MIFEAANLLIMPAWLAMLLAPRHRFTPRLALYTPVVLALTYAALVAPQMRQLLPLLARPTLGEIAALLGTPAGATIGWLHFLAFDLLIGRWILLQSQDLPRWRTAPILVLTLLFGPLGWALHFLTKNVRRPLPGLVSLCVLGAALSLGGLFLDPRTILGVPAWLKPLKFFLSAGLYAWTLDRLLTFVEPVKARLLERVNASCLGLELVLITLQAARGTTSHFNQSTLLDGLIFSLMGLGIAVVWLASLALASWARPSEPALRSAVRWGIGVSFLGMAVGWLMVALHGHTVGAPDGGPGLPLVNWSLEHGDLRVAHFVGLHALQVTLLVALFAPRAVTVAGKACLGLLVLLTVQALRGQSVTAPDLWTVLGLAAVATYSLVPRRPSALAGPAAAAPPR